MNFKKKIRTVVKRITASVLNKTGIVHARLKKGGVIILMFHKIDDKCDQLPLTICPEIFDRIISEITSRYNIVPLEALINENGELIVDDEVKFAITFDDGYRDNYEKGFPILRKHNVPATIYLSYGHMEGQEIFWYEKLTSGLLSSQLQSIDLEDLGSEKFSLNSQEDRDLAIYKLNLWLKTFTDKERTQLLTIILERLQVDESSLDVSPMLTWEMVKEMKENNINFGSHTISHPILSREDKQSIEKEVVESRWLLEKKTGDSYSGFAYPNGTEDDYNDTVLEFTRSTYQHACTTTPGINYRGQDPYQLKRVNIDPGMCTNEKGKFLPDLFWAKIASLI